MLLDFTHKTPADFIDEIGWCFASIFLLFLRKSSKNCSVCAVRLKNTVLIFEVFIL